MIRNFYFSLKKYLLEKSSKYTNSRLAYPFIFVLCFLESIIFPFPQEVFMIPMMASNRDRIFKIAWFALLGSLLGAIAAYFIGMYLFESIGMYILNLYSFVSTDYLKNQKRLSRWSTKVKRPLSRLLKKLENPQLLFIRRSIEFEKN